MRIQGEYTFDGPREAVWVLVRDPEVLASCLPGTQSVKKVGENKYSGEIQVRIGPITGVFAGDLFVTNEVPPASCTLTVEGKGKVGFLKGTGNIDMIDLGGNKTLMKFTGEVQIGGKVASVGQRLFDTVSRGMIKQGLDKLNEILQARIAEK
ncbi:MAG: carbon monoxide dehydrogenase subunit G [Chloroflexi bacterium]|nr:carbon monoxide dehydrogenase subunit G [Chloroflexota bacterium]